MTRTVGVPTDVTVLGGGNSAFATAAALSLHGHTVRLLEVPEMAETIAPVQQPQSIVLEAPGLESMETGEAPLACVTTDPAEALDGTEVVLFVVPAYAEARFTELCLDHFSSSQLIVFFCGNFGGALAFAHHLQRAERTDLPLVVETDGLYYGGFKSGPSSVRLSGLKAGLVAAAFPAVRNEEGLTLLNGIFPNYDFGQAHHVIETGLRNMNPMLHAPISILNVGRTAPERPSFLYYKEGVTPGVGEIIARADEERIAVGSALELELASLYQVILNWYGWQGAGGDTLHELLSTNPAYQTARAPMTLEHRFLTEDVPYGLVPISELGQAMGTQTPVIDSLITLTSALLEQNVRANGRDLVALGMEGLDAGQIITYVQTADLPAA